MGRMTASRRRRSVLAYTACVLGAALLALSLVLTFTKASATSTTTVKVTGALTQPASFLDNLAVALRSGDVTYLQAHLDPAVVARYGGSACGAHLARLTDPTAAFSVQSVSPPMPYVYATPSGSTTVPQTLSIVTRTTSHGSTSTATVHLARLPSGALAWFTACT
jgi:hypothetical protein